MPDARQRMEILAALGVQFTHEYEYVGEVGTPERQKVDLPDTFYAVELPFSPEEWMDIAQNEGDHYVGGCCGNMSALQDEIENVFRFGGSVNNREMSSIAHWAHEHDGFATFDPMDDETFRDQATQFPFLGPWEKLGVIYNAVESVLRLGEDQPFPARTEDNEYREGQEALSDLQYGLRNIAWSDMFELHEEDKDRHTAQRKLELAKIYPLVKRLAETLDEMKIDFEGYAIVDQQNQLLTNGYGACIYTSEVEARRIVDLMNNSDNLRGRSQDLIPISVVPCKVSREEGLVLGQNMVL